jgi:hypothetical protein
MQAATAPGFYVYTDPIGSPPERLEVVLVAGELMARFAGGDNDEAALVPVADMAGEFSPA